MYGKKTRLARPSTATDESTRAALVREILSASDEQIQAILERMKREILTESDQS